MAGQTVLGDITHPTPIVVAGGNQSSSIPALAALAAGAMIPGAGIAGYAVSKMLEQDPPPAVQPAEDTSVSIGLGRLEDYLKQE